jgi:hypothetical protein
MSSVNEIRSVKVENKRIVPLGKHGEPISNGIGSTYISAGKSGDFVVGVAEDGRVDEFEIHEGRSLSYKRSLGKTSSTPQSVQVGGEGDFTVLLENGQMDAWTNFSKSRSSFGSAHSSYTSSYSAPKYEETYSYQDSSSDESNESSIEIIAQVVVLVGLAAWFLYVCYFKWGLDILHLKN